MSEAVAELCGGFCIRFLIRSGTRPLRCSRYLQPDDVTHRSLYTTQSSFYAQVFLHREVCAQRNFCTQTPLHTEAFTQRRKFLHTDALCKDAFAHINKGT